MREFAVGDRLVDPRQILVNDPARAEIQVADFGVAHLAFGQTDIRPARAQLARRIVAVKMIVKRRPREQRGVAVFLALGRDRRD